MRLANLKPSISELPQKEALSLVLSVRANRRAVPARKPLRKSSTKPSSSVSLASLSKHQILTLLDQLDTITTPEEQDA